MQTTRDSNPHGRLGAGDIGSFGVADADGQNYRDALLNVERILGVEFLSDNVADVGFSTPDGDYVAEIDLARRQVRRQNVLRYHQHRRTPPLNVMDLASPQ